MYFQHTLNRVISLKVSADINLNLVYCPTVSSCRRTDTHTYKTSIFTYALRLNVDIRIILEQLYTWCTFPFLEGLGPQILLQPRNATIQEGSLYSLECIFLHTSKDFLYIMIRQDTTISRIFNYSTASGLPSLTLSVYDSTRSVCYAGHGNLIQSRYGYITVNRKSG